MLNIYDELGIDPSEPTAGIKERLARIKANDATRASRPDSAGDAARLRISRIKEIEQCFDNDTSRDEYDRSLHVAPLPAASTGPNWLQLAWAYYAQGDFGPAEVSARKAREDDKDNPDVWVVSAWIALAPLTRHPLTSDEPREVAWSMRPPVRPKVMMNGLIIPDTTDRDTSNQPNPQFLVEAAKRFADEAYAPFGSAAAGDVAHVRGVCFYFLQDFPRAVQSYKSALAASDNAMERAELHLRMALAHEAAGEPDQAVIACETALSDEPTGVEAMQTLLESLWSRSVVKLCDSTPLSSRSVEYEHWSDRARNSSMNKQAATILSENCDENAQRLDEYTAKVAEAEAARERLKQAQEELRALQTLPRSQSPVHANAQIQEIDEEIARTSFEFRQLWQSQYPSLCTMGIDVNSNGPITSNEITNLTYRLRNVTDANGKGPMGCVLPLALWLVPMVIIGIMFIVAINAGDDSTMSTAQGLVLYLCLAVSFVGFCMGIYALVKTRDRKAWQVQHTQWSIAQEALYNLPEMTHPITSLWESRASEEERVKAERQSEEERLQSVIAAEQDLTAYPSYPAPVVLGNYDS